jgi:hypothetical protein
VKGVVAPYFLEELILSKKTVQFANHQQEAAEELSRQKIL